ncbi:hypothetical protein P280DRAFT_481050 [Massarina eburnea CBS 473.64]|uniref:Uncharacterized protein n=1 Tax=Massarina eburnea CBS 473.64 TaxID=1395130 RepID=A0A6A6RXA3_9PLEO|nr:hypothetical protein P280DRAFT_481050 [Massarina eburnea CBS 473.64]
MRDILLYIEGEDLATEIESHLARHIRISFPTIIRVMKELFSAFQWRRSTITWDTTPPQYRIADQLSKVLSSNIQMKRWPSLKTARHRFVVLCYVAHDFYSAPLAECLYQFATENAYEITNYEDPPYMYEWDLAVRKLRDLIGDKRTADLQDLLGFNNSWDYGRGRRPMRDVWRPRAITAPPFRYRTPSRLRIIGPEFYSGLPSPVLDPAVEELVENQILLQAQIDELKDVEPMGYGFPPEHQTPLQRRIAYH